MFRPAFGCCKHPKAGRNTQHFSTLSWATLYPIYRVIIYDCPWMKVRTYQSVFSERLTTSFEYPLHTTALFSAVRPKKLIFFKIFNRDGEPVARDGNWGWRGGGRFFWFKFEFEPKERLECERTIALSSVASCNLITQPFLDLVVYLCHQFLQYFILYQLWIVTEAR